MSTLINDILNVFDPFRMAPTPVDQYEQVGKTILGEKLQPFINRNAPIEFVMLGFPFKSMNNRDKVLGTKPDLGEELTLRNFADFNNKIKQIYAPGVTMNIVSDGYIFNDIMDVSDYTVAEYKDIASGMGQEVGAPMAWYDINDFFKNMSMSSMRQKTMEQFGISEIELEKRILMDPDVNFLYRGMIRFMEGDLAIRDFPSRNQLNKEAKKFAREMMLRNEAYSALVRTQFSSFIRLSMHPSINNGVKYSFQLIPSKKAWTSPWHCAVLIDEENDFATIHRKDAEGKYQIEYKNGYAYNYHA